MSLSGIKQQISRMLRPPRRLRFTPEGTRFVIVALAIGVAAINTGNNLLYLILAMMLSMIIISGILSESSLRMVDIRRSLPREAFAGRPFLVRIAAMNGKRRLPSVSLTFQDGHSGAGPASFLYFLKIPPKSQSTHGYHLTLERRGIYRFQEGRLLTRYPFGLFVKSKDAGDISEMLVYPKILELKELLRESGVNEGELESRIKGKGTDLYGLRGYVSGDDMRAVHWKTSAKLSKLYVKEFARADVRRIMLFLDDCIPEGCEDALEKGITITASLASRFIDKGYQVGLVTSKEELRMDIGAGHLYRMLRVLALLTPGKDSGRLLEKAADAEGVLVLPCDNPVWRDKEKLFAKVIRVGR